MQGHSDRFADGGKTITDFTNLFLVQCPQCEGRAEVKLFGDSHRLVCTACRRVEQEGRWYGAVRLTVRRNCPFCGERKQYAVTSNQDRDTLSVPCDQCGKERGYPALKSRLPYRDGLKVDPVFGLPLWIQTDFQGELFWAFNFEHLNYIKNYIAAKLRERGIAPRNTIRKNTSLVSRLPAFVKKAGNREALLKCIAALEAGKP